MTVEADRNLRLFRELLTCCGNIWSWTYDSRMTLADTNCPDSAALEFFFSLEERQRLIEIRNRIAVPRPVVLSNALRMTWIADFESGPDGAPLYTHLIGPVFTEEIPLKSIEDALSRKSLSPAVREEFLRLLGGLPVVLLTRFLEYGLMLHFCITGEKLSVSDLQYADTLPERKHPSNDKSAQDLHGTWAMEQRMMKMMEEGNLEYMKFASRLTSLGNLGSIGNGDFTRELKNYVIVHTALCTRAAIRGGLAPEIAYTLSDQYINGIEGSRSLAEIADVNTAMQEDFVLRVHRCRSGMGVSAQIQSCCEYIQLHLGEKMTLAQLAKWTGYSGTYLSRKFKSEVGQTISEYTMACRIEQAKNLLTSGEYSVQEICESLGFGSQSYFGEQFRRATGMTPGEYRNRGCRN